MRTRFAFLVPLFFFIASPCRAKDYSADVIVYGSTASGIMAAVAVARAERTVLIVEPGKHYGGMLTGGLGATDIGNRGAIGGYSREFFDRVKQHYIKEYGADSQQVKDCFDGFRFEPKVASTVLASFLKESDIVIHPEQRLESVEREGGRIVALKTAKGDSFKGLVYIDATYEGDLMAAAGVKYHVGRESSSAYGESLAGVQKFSTAHQWPVKVNGLEGKNRLPLIQADQLGKPGDGDRKVQAYNYRLCLTDNPKNQVPFPKPTNYEPARYELLARYLEARPNTTVGQLMHPVRVPNRKTDTNNNGPFSTDHIGANWDYPEADHKRRLAIVEDHISYTKGFLYFLANDRRVPAKLRTEMNTWGLAKDEYVGNGNWPTQLYIREARRMIGEHVMTQADLMEKEKRTKDDSVGVGSYNTDSHHVQRILDDKANVLNEGDFQVPVLPYAIPYRALTPKAKECENLLVPVCLSSSHVAYGTIRMEPVFMSLGQASGVAAVLSIEGEVSVQKIPINRLTLRLKRQKAILSPADVPVPKNARVLDSSTLAGIVVDDEEAKYTGVWLHSRSNGPYVDKGYRHDGDAGKGQKAARFTPKLKGGKHQVYLHYSPAGNRASNVLVVVKSFQAESSYRVDQRQVTNGDTGLLIGTFDFAPGSEGWVEIRNHGTSGHVVADAVRFVPVK